MRHVKLLAIAIASFLGAILGEGLVRRAIALLLCGVLSFNSTTCYGYFTSHDQANAIQPLSLTHFENQRNSVNSILNLSLAKEPQFIADIPRIRKPELDLPPDIRIVRQIPYKSGKREIQFVSPSSGIEQVYFTSLPDAEKFELFGIEFKKVGNIDLSPLLVGKDLQFNPSEIQSLLQEFKINFKDNSLSKVVLADGTIAEFSQSQAVIKSPKDQELERVQLSQVKSFSKRMFDQGSEKIKNLKENIKEKDDNTSSIFISQAGSSCQSTTAAHLQNSASTMAQQGNQLISNGSKYSLSVGAALNYANSSLKSNVIPKELTQTVCTPPVKCNEQVISGGSEIRTDLFDVPQGANRQVTLNYEFFQIPDKLEMDFDGKRVFEIGPASGSSTQSFSFPNDAKYVGVKLIGNQENKATKWWYKVACSGEEIAHPCNDTRIGTNYDKTNSKYHYYKNNNLLKICSKKMRGCTKKKVFETMISEVRFIAPTDSKEGVISCKEEVLIPGIGFKDYYPEFYKNRIKAVINANDLLVTNYTLPGHMFYPGEIRRRVVDTGDAIEIETIGEGIGDNRTINLLFGTQGLWDLIDGHLREKVQSILSK
ncbi:MAG: hypothetical protein C6Y22_01680 [Hapalosiphonaceae cyanobacterium JJU2]|nr:MAG: hypothetical protein C6Y22_01680 [Hapalosiphonaceae cyanobacterium JJU2]